ncbi:MAG TPA: HemK family protein methyltransferase [Actinomycetota bacterium]|nr:HemK family protein methyltransferase [Actinomycetota bacterium]
MAEPRAVKQLLELGLRVLEDSSAIFDDHDSEAEARELLAKTLGVDEGDLEEAFEPSRRVRERYLSLIARRAGGEPFPFLMGSINFYGLDLKVRVGPFIPRPSSELLVDRVLKRLGRRKSAVVVDVCTGQGPIALAIASEKPGIEVWGLDIDEHGIAQGRRNAKSHGLDVNFRTGDLFAPLPKRLHGSVDVISAHVPYVAPHELEDLPAEVIEHEPIFTLSDDSIDGLSLMRRTVEESVAWLRPGGWLLLELAEDLAPKVRKMCRKEGLDDNGIASDNDDLSVVVEARRPK